MLKVRGGIGGRLGVGLDAELVDLAGLDQLGRLQGELRGQVIGGAFLVVGPPFRLAPIWAPTAVAEKSRRLSVSAEVWPRMRILLFRWPAPTLPTRGRRAGACFEKLVRRLPPAHDQREHVSPSNVAPWWLSPRGGRQEMGHSRQLYPIHIAQIVERQNLREHALHAVVGAHELGGGPGDLMAPLRIAQDCHDPIGDRGGAVVVAHGGGIAHHVARAPLEHRLRRRRPRPSPRRARRQARPRARRSACPRDADVSSEHIERGQREREPLRGWHQPEAAAEAAPVGFARSKWPFHQARKPNTAKCASGKRSPINCAARTHNSGRFSG